MSARARRGAVLAIVLLAAPLLVGCALATPVEEETHSAKTTAEEATVAQMTVNVNGIDFIASLESNPTAAALVKMMEEGPITVSLSDYAGFEKVGQLGLELPAEDALITTEPGDIVLYQGKQIVIFCGTNSWSYTPLAHVSDLTGWEDALGAGDVTITLSLRSLEE